MKTYNADPAFLIQQRYKAENEPKARTLAMLIYEYVQRIHDEHHDRNIQTIWERNGTTDNPEVKLSTDVARRYHNMLEQYMREWYGDDKTSYERTRLSQLRITANNRVINTMRKHRDHEHYPDADMLDDIWAAANALWTFMQD
jgi:hypothetical protein